MQVKKSIYLTGFMGSGKTTIGKLLAKKLNLPFVDLDRYIEDKTGKGIKEIFVSDGETAFRETEHSCLTDILKTTTVQVVALGGGTVCFKNNVELIKNHGQLFYLKTNPVTLFHRLKTEISSRPILHGQNENTLQHFITAKIAEREKFYLLAHHYVNSDETENGVIDEIISHLPQ